MISSIISRLVILVFGTLYPAYASYKAVRTKNLKEYVKWMMYWIVFALFTCTETFTDVFLSWFPFYYEVKIVLVLWLLSPATKGSSILYRKFVHPALCRREQEIDEYIAKAKDQGYHTVLNLGTKGVNYATNVIMQTAIKGGGGLVQQLRKSYSLSDLSECEPREERGGDEADDVMTEPRLIRRAVTSGYNTRRSASESNNRTSMYFPEVDVDVRPPRVAKTEEPDFSHIKSSEDISSGYSSADNSASLTRSMSGGARSRQPAPRAARTSVTSIKRPPPAEDDEVIIEELHGDDTYEYSNMPPLVNLPSHLFLSHTDPPFIYQYVGDQVKIVQVLGNYPLSTENPVNNSNPRDQNETVTNVEESVEQDDFVECEKIPDVNETNEDKNNANMTNNIAIDVPVENAGTDIITNNEDVIETKPIDDSVPIVNSESSVDNVVKEENKQPDTAAKSLESDQIETSDSKVDIETKIPDIDTNTNLNVPSIIADDATSLDTSFYDNESVESDDEASFGTPEDSPKSKRKSPKGKYGKGKAPPPPLKVERVETPTDGEVREIKDSQPDAIASTTSNESLVEIINNLPTNTFKQTGGSKSLQVVNPISEKKRRHKSKSPGRVPKASASGITKLLQLPSKLAFWHKSDEKVRADTSTSSGDLSRRSSTVEKAIDEFSSCSDLTASLSNNVANTAELTKSELADDDFSFRDAADLDTDMIFSETQGIMEKSDALQRLIEAKIESHPEYKFVSLHEDIPTTSKSTDV